MSLTKRTPVIETLCAPSFLFPLWVVLVILSARFAHRETAEWFIRASSRPMVVICVLSPLLWLTAFIVALSFRKKIVSKVRTWIVLTLSALVIVATWTTLDRFKP
jgi:hypothetical protein